MATVTSDFIAALFTEYDVMFEDQFLAATRVNDYKRLCTVIPSKTLTEDINWLGTVPQMREWVDERVHQGIANAFTYSVTNKHYEATIDVDVDTIEDDRYGLILPRVGQLGLEAGRYPWVLAVNAITNNGTCYDGQAFFSASHAEEASGTQSNLVAATGQTVAALMTDFGTALARMRGFKDNKGRHMYLGQMGPASDLVVFAPAALEQVWRQVLNAEFLPASGGVAAPESNWLKGAADLVIDPYLDDNSTTAWYLADMGSISVKPLIYLDRKPPTTTARTDPRDPLVYEQRMYSWGVDFRGNVGYGWWQTMVKVS